jgi:hypothetical protein
VYKSCKGSNLILGEMLVLVEEWFARKVWMALGQCWDDFGSCLPWKCGSRKRFRKLGVSDFKDF